MCRGSGESVNQSPLMDRLFFVPAHVNPRSRLLTIGPPCVPTLQIVLTFENGQNALYFSASRFEEARKFMALNFLPKHLGCAVSSSIAVGANRIDFVNFEDVRMRARRTALKLQRRQKPLRL